MNTTDDIASRYVQIWNEGDAGERARAVRSLWVDDGANYTDSSEYRGHADIERRVTVAWEKWVRDTGHVFRAGARSAAHHRGVKVHWEMVTAAGEVSSVGFDFLVLDVEGRIVTDHQFLEP